MNRPRCWEYDRIDRLEALIAHADHMADVLYRQACDEGRHSLAWPLFMSRRAVVLRRLGKLR